MATKSDNDQGNIASNPPPQTASVLGDNEHPMPDDMVGHLSIQVKLSCTPHKMIYYIVLVTSSQDVLERRWARTLPALGAELGVPNLVTLTWHFLFNQYHPDDDCDPTDIPLSDCPRYDGSINVYNSACA